MIRKTAIMEVYRPQAKIFHKWFLGKGSAFSSRGLEASLLGSESHLTTFPQLAPISVWMPVPITFHRFCSFYSLNVSFENEVQILCCRSDFLWVWTVGRHRVIKAHTCKLQACLTDWCVLPSDWCLIWIRMPSRQSLEKAKAYGTLSKF